MVIGLLGPAAALCLAAVGSALGIGFAAQGAVGSWKKCYATGKKAPFMAVAFAGAPLTQTIYGFLLMGFLRSAPETVAPLHMLSAGIFGGLAIGASALMQGKVGATASDALAETGQGTANYLMVIGIVESVALLTMVFLYLTLQA